MRRWGLVPEQWRNLSDDDRETMVAEYELVCQSCGNLRSVCSDPAVPWYPQRAMCYAQGALEVTLRTLAEKYKDKKPQPGVSHPTDGMGVWVSTEDLTPDDNFV